MRSLTFWIFRRLFSILYGTPVARAIWKIPGAAAFYRWLVPLIRPSEVVVDGHVIHLDKLDSLLLSVNGNYEAAEQRLFVNCLRPGDTVLDIGAHIGLYTLQAARAVGPEGEVIAFEPAAATFELLKRNISLNGYQNVTAVRAAVSAADGEVDLTMSVDNTGDNALLTELTKGRQTRERVTALTVDGYLHGSRQVNVIKIDIQGAEPAVLAGAKATLAASESLIVFTELSPAHLVDWGGLGGYLRTLADLGFTFFEIIEDDAAVIERTVEDLTSRNPDNKTFWNAVCVKGSDAMSRFHSAAQTARTS